MKRIGQNITDSTDISKDFAAFDAGIRLLMKIFFLSLILFTTTFFGFSEARAQSRKAVNATEVNGTFRDYFSGRFKGSHNEIKILALGKGKLKISFDLVYPFIDGTGGEMANVGQAQGIAEIDGDTAVFTSDELEGCKITIKFVKPGAIKVDQGGTDGQCGFGFNVSASGNYRKFSGAKPKFDAQ